jgi:hypothetical protein
MKRNKSNILFLTGGLGNQLFQLSFGLAVTDGDLLLDVNLGTPRRNSKGLPDLVDFELPEKVTPLVSKYSRFVSRLVGYNLRIGVVPRKIEKRRIYLFVIKMISSVLISLHYKRWLMLYVSQGVGHSTQQITKMKNKLIVGYFQNSGWLNQQNVRIAMASLSIKEPSSEYVRLLEKIRSEPTTIVHIRLGDYLQEPNFGIPNKNYLENAIKLIQKNTGECRVWGFSDEPDKARVLLLSVNEREIFWLPSNLLNTAETFGLMREGNGYVIANSTFSWWAAALRYNLGSQVVCPEPWFAGMEEPSNLVPLEWTRIKAY